MLWAVLAAVVSTTPTVDHSGIPLGTPSREAPRLAPLGSPMTVASTYDEAACADEKQPDKNDDINCSEPPPVAIPAVLDCNDARVSLWLGEMIGSCDMPRP